MVNVKLFDFFMRIQYAEQKTMRNHYAQGKVQPAEVMPGLKKGGELVKRYKKGNNSVWLRNLPQTILRNTK